MAKSGTASQLRGAGAEGSGETRQALIRGAIETLKAGGFAGASARAIAGRAGCNQGLVFYHFGSVANLLLAALDAVSAERLEHYSESVSSVDSISDLVGVAADIFQEDLDAGHIAVLAEMIAGASSTPGLGPEVARRVAPWTRFAQQAVDSSLADSPLGSVIPSADIAYAIVALYLGLEMLSHLDGDRAPALALFGHVKNLAGLFAGFGGPVESTISMTVPSGAMPEDKPPKESRAPKAPDKRVLTNEAVSKGATSKRAASKRAASKRAASKRAASKRAASKRAASKRAASTEAVSNRAPSTKASSKGAP
jgi:AcrR family transcriptional regulator